MVCCMRCSERLRKLGDEDAYERGVHRHWMFFLVTSPPIMMFGLMVVFLAVVKPF